MDRDPENTQPEINPNLQDENQGIVSPTPELTPEPVAPSVSPAPQTLVAQQPIKGVKLYFLGLIIVGAGAMGLTSVIALLLGGFNDIVGKAILTIFILLTHALLALTIVAIAKPDYIKRSILAVTLLATIAASIVSTTLGTWALIPVQFAWHLLGLYFLLLGGAFILTWFRSALIKVPKSDLVIVAAMVATVIMIITIAPWTLIQTPTFPSIYYRAVAAIGIIVATLMIIGSIVRQILLSHKVGIKTDVFYKNVPAGLIVIYSVIGGIVLMTWLAGSVRFSINAIQSSQPSIAPVQRYDPNSGDPYGNTYDPYSNSDTNRTY